MKRTTGTALSLILAGLVAIVTIARAQQTRHDETSEANAGLWATRGMTPGTAGPHAAAHLLLTEVSVTPTPHEYIEIHNPTASAVDLSKYYLTDAWFGSLFVESYHLLPTGTFSITTNDFCVQFPVGASIAAGGTLVIALYGAGVDSSFGAGTVDYEVTSSSAAIPDMVNVGANVPPIGPGATTLTNGSEFVMLFYWDGASDNVCDIDYVTWGTSSSTSRVDKTGLAVDGPDGDAIATPYFADMPIVAQSAVTAPGGGSSVTRITGTEGAELEPGNGCAICLGYRDADGDGYGDPSDSTPCPIPSGYVSNSSDCDDTRASVHPGALEFCDGLDNDCDGPVDEGALGPIGLVGWWKAEGNANDATHNNYNGTLRNGATFAAGQVGQAFSLDGIDDYVDNLGNASSFAFVQNTGKFTFEGWIRLDNPDALREQTIAANIFSPADKGFYFGVVNSGGQHQLQAALGRGGTLIIDSRSPQGVITAGWHHLAATGNGANVTFYVDGVSHAGSGTMTALSSGDATRRVDLGWDGVGSYLGGQIDELAIYTRALTESQIRAIYNAGSGGRCALVGVDDPAPSARAFEFAVPWPNPATRGTNMRFNLPIAAHVRVDVFDIAGRRVGSPIDGQYLRAGEHRVAWDGRGASGRRVTPGIYEVRIATGATVGVRRIVMIR